MFDRYLLERMLHKAVTAYGNASVIAVGAVIFLYLACYFFRRKLQNFGIVCQYMGCVAYEFTGAEDYFRSFVDNVNIKHNRTIRFCFRLGTAFMIVGVLTTPVFLCLNCYNSLVANKQHVDVIINIPGLTFPSEKTFSLLFCTYCRSRSIMLFLTKHIPSTMQVLSSLSPFMN